MVRGCFGNMRRSCGMGGAVTGVKELGMIREIKKLPGVGSRKR